MFRQLRTLALNFEKGDCIVIPPGFWAFVMTIFLELILTKLRPEIHRLYSCCMWRLLYLSMVLARKGE